MMVCQGDAIRLTGIVPKRELEGNRGVKRAVQRINRAISKKYTSQGPEDLPVRVILFQRLLCQWIRCPHVVLFEVSVGSTALSYPFSERKSQENSALSKPILRMYL